MTGFNEYDDYDATGLAELVKKGEVSPTELLEEAIERLERVNPKINAVVHKMYEGARGMAESDDLPDGPFRGVPFLIKDLLASYAGEPMTGGCRFTQSYVPDHDSEMVKRMKAAGLVIFGKTNTPEFGIMGVTEPDLHGPTRNPWNTAHTSGGSSGGSAAATAARVVPMAHGGDGGGSIRIPASACGLFGLKPTRARNPMGPDAAEGWGGYVSQHVLTRSVRDSAAMLDVFSGRDIGDPYSAPHHEGRFADEVGADPGKLKIAFTPHALFGDETHADCRLAVDDAVKLCRELGHTVVEDWPSFDRRASVKSYLMTVAAHTAHDIDVAAKLMGKAATPDGFEASTWFISQIGRYISATELLEAFAQVNETCRSVGEFFEGYDVLLTPNLARPPVEIGELAPSKSELFGLGLMRRLPVERLLRLGLDQMADNALAATPNTQLFNQTGQPAMSVPLHWNGEGLPIGTQFVGRFGAEGTLLRLAAQLEGAQPWADKRPPIVG